MTCRVSRLVVDYKISTPKLYSEEPSILLTHTDIFYLLQTIIVPETSEKSSWSSSFFPSQVIMASEFPKVGVEWRESSPGVFERGFDPIEVLVHNLRIQGIHDIVIFKVKLGFGDRDLVHAARKAWIALRYQHPSLAAEHDGCRKCFEYRSPTDEDFKQWVDASLQVIQNMDADAYFVDPSFALFPKLIVFPKTSELVLQAPHIYLDGPGGVSILASLIADLPNPPNVAFGSESKNLDVALSTFLGIQEITPDDEKRCRDLLQVAMGNMPSIGVPILWPIDEVQGDNPLKTRVKVHAFTPSDSEKLIEACKTAQLTPTHALHAAIIKATQDTATDKSEKFTSVVIMSFSESDRAKPEYTERSQGLGSSVLVYSFPFSITPGTKSFMDVAAEVKKIYEEFRDDSSIERAYPPLSLAMAEMVAKQSVSADKLQKDAPLLSSWGILEKRLPRMIGDVEVLDFGFSIAASKHTAPIVYLWTFRDRLVITIRARHAYMSEEMMDEFVGLLVKEMTEGLKVSI